MLATRLALRNQRRKSTLKPQVARKPMHISVINNNRSTNRDSSMRPAHNSTLASQATAKAPEKDRPAPLRTQPLLPPLQAPTMPSSAHSTPLSNSYRPRPPRHHPRMLRITQAPVLLAMLREAINKEDRHIIRWERARERLGMRRSRATKEAELGPQAAAAQRRGKARTRILPSHMEATLPARDLLKLSRPHNPRLLHKLILSLATNSSSCSYKQLEPAKHP